MTRIDKRIRALALAGAAGKLSKVIGHRSCGINEHFCLSLSPEELEGLDSCVLRLLVDHNLDLAVWFELARQKAVERLREIGRLDTLCVFRLGGYGYMTPLCFAAWQQDAALAEQLLRAGANPNQPDQTGATALGIAIREKSLEIVRLLARCNTKPELYVLIRGSIRTRYKSGCEWVFTRDMVLGKAVAMGGDEEMLLELAGMGVDVNARSESGATALHLAAEENQAAAVRTLLSIPGVDPTLRDKQQRTAMEMTGSQEIRRMLTDAGCPVPPKLREHGYLSFSALRESGHLQGLVLPFGFGTYETLAHTDLRYADLSRTVITLNQLDQLGDLTGIQLPASLAITPEQARERGIGPEQMPSPLRIGEPRDPFGAPCRLLRAARKLIVYRRIHSLHALPEGESLENLDLRALSGTLTVEILSAYRRFYGVIFPRGLNLAEHGEKFFGKREFIYCDFSEVDGFPANVWALTKIIRGSRLPPGIDFREISFLFKDLTDTDFSLQFAYERTNQGAQRGGGG